MAFKINRQKLKKVLSRHGGKLRFQSAHGAASEPEKNQKSIKISRDKAKEILADGEVRGQPLTDAQKRLFGFIAGGGKPTRLKEGRHERPST